MNHNYRKISVTQLVRLLIQIVLFIFLPVLYVNAFHGIKQIYLAIIQQNFDFAQLLPQLAETIVIIPFTILMGRFFCGWMCAFGAFGDFIFHISSKLFKIKFRMNEKADQVLKPVKYILLVFLVFAVWTFDVKVFSSFSPWDAFGMLATIGKTPDFSYAATNLTVGLTFFIFIVIGSFFIERFFCRYLCPLGAIFAITSKLKIAKIRKPSDQCGECQICTSSCSVGIPLYKTEVVDSGECIMCMKCVTACPRKNVALTIAQNDIRPLAAGIAAVAVMIGLYYGMGALGTNTASNPVGEDTSAVSGTYKDGTYQGSGTGFRGATTTVEVTVKNGKITDITTISYGDDRPFYSKAFPVISQDVVSRQSSDVDTVSGATYSSDGIKEAIADALSKA